MKNGDRGMHFIWSKSNARKENGRTIKKSKQSKGIPMSDNQIQIHVENIKYGGCEKSIEKGLKTINGLSNIVINRDQQIVSVTAEDSLRDAIVEKLKSMGYPEYSSVSGFDAGLANARSFVSCAIGRVS